MQVGFNAITFFLIDQLSWFFHRLSIVQNYKTGKIFVCFITVETNLFNNTCFSAVQRSCAWIEKTLLKYMYGTEKPMMGIIKHSKRGNESF